MFLSRWARLYTTPTKSENAIEPAIARLGRRYRAQHPVFACGVVLDFALIDEMIAIEVDGDSHKGKTAQDKDRARTLKLEARGWVVVRCTNEEAQSEPDAVLQRMLLEAADRRKAIAMLRANFPEPKKKVNHA